jgi:uncharacterized membrane protein
VIDPDTRPGRPGLWLALMVGIYTVLFSFYCYRRHWSYAVGDWDLGIMDQSFWTAAFAGLPFYNTWEGVSHFGFHNSASFLLLLPLYRLAPSAMTLLFVQSLVLALGAVPVYLLARDLLAGREGVSGERCGLVFAALYLLNFPLHGVNYHEFHETSLVVAPFLLAMWGLYTGRRGALWVGAVLGMLGREDMGVLVILMGLLGLFWRARGRFSPSLGDCLGLLGMGALWTWISFRIVLPHFGHGTESLRRLDHLGGGPLAWLLSPVLRPVAFWGPLFRGSSISYLLGLIGPLAFLPLRAWPTLLIMAPILIVNLESSFGGMHLFTSHYAGPLIPFVFAAGIEGFSTLSLASMRTALRACLALTVLLMLLFDPSPLHIGRWPMAVDAHARALDEVCCSIPSDASVSATPNLWTHLTHRVRSYPHYEPGVDYVVLDETQVQFVKEAHFDESLPPLLASGAYRLERAVDGAAWHIRVYRRNGR